MNKPQKKCRSAKITYSGIKMYTGHWSFLSKNKQESWKMKKEKEIHFETNGF